MYVHNKINKNLIAWHFDFANSVQTSFTSLATACMHASSKHGGRKVCEPNCRNTDQYIDQIWTETGVCAKAVAVQQMGRVEYMEEHATGNLSTR